MKAVIWTKYGPPDVLQLRDVAKPTPKDNEILVKVHAATVTAGDCEIRSLKFPPYLAIPIRLYAGPIRPTRLTIIGQEYAGEVEAVGKEVTRYKVGDQIFGNTGFGAGAYAEYICLREVRGEMDGVFTHKPSNLSFEEAAAVPTGGLEALHFLRKANLRPGQRILINGAGGSIGTFGVQLAKLDGVEVTAVDRGEKLEMLRSLGADHVIDYTQEDFTKSGQRYDVIFDVVGKAPFSGAIRSLAENGVYLLANPNLRKMIGGWWVSRRGGKQVVAGGSEMKLDDLLYLKELFEAGKLDVVIDRSYPLAETAEAHRYVETGMKKGNVVIQV